MKNKMLKAKYLAALLLFFCFYTHSRAQQLSPKDLTDEIAGKMELYRAKMQSPVLFIHFDKNVYSTNENVWFTGYFLNLVNPEAYRVLSLALIRDDDHLIVFNDKFIINNGLSFGNTVIPDTIAAGHYSFIAYTNWLLNGRPDVLFTQRVTIKKDAQASYRASLNPLDTSSTLTQQKVMLLVTNNNTSKKMVSKLPVRYYVGNSMHPVLKGEVRTTEAGQYILNIPSRLLVQGSNRLHVRITREAEVKDLTIDLPSRPKAATVHFFPEGGNMVTGIKSTVAWEVKGYADKGMTVDGILYEDKKIIDTIHTNSYGFGRFVFQPKAGARYHVKLFGINQKDTIYNLPNALSHIPVLSLPEAVVNDVLYADLKTTVSQRVYINVHNYEQLFSSTEMNLTSSVKRIKILLSDIPKGLLQLTITDSLGRPLAERMAFVHYNIKSNLQISTDKARYITRQKVTLKLRLNNPIAADSGVVSIACVQENRLQINNENDIESYFYLKNQLGDLPVKENYLGAEDADKQFLEDILLIKGWRRYTWLDMLKVTPADTVTKRSDLVFNGLVDSYGTKIKKPVEVMNFNHPMDVVQTDSAGNFKVSEKELVVERNKKLRFFVNNDKKELYQVKLVDPYLPTTKKVVEEMEFADQNLPSQENTQLLEMTGFEHAFKLKEVKIKANDDNLFIGFGANACGDYVCRYHILNCPNHSNERDNTPPVVGRSYYMKGGLAVYTGCSTENEQKADVKAGIYAAQEFYPSDLSQPDAPPEFQSTIYWKYLAKVTSVKEVEYTFYTNDITGLFKIVVQGCTAKDVIYGEQSFEVQKPK